VTSSTRPTPGQGVLVGFGHLINESFHHNVAYVENDGDSEVKLVQIDTWDGDDLAFHDNVYIAADAIRPFEVIQQFEVMMGTNLKMFDNLYFFAEEPLPFRWNDEVYSSIEEWQADTGLDANSQFVIGPLGSRAQNIIAALEALMLEPTLRPDMFYALHRLANGPNLAMISFTPVRR
jgi:hypothetical protein